MDGFPVGNDIRESYDLTSSLFYLYFNILVELLREIDPPVLGNRMLLTLFYAII